MTRARLSKLVVLGAFLLGALSIEARAATIEGRVIHPTRPEAAAVLEVFVLGVLRSGESLERRTTTNANGEFELADLPSPAAYLLAAVYDEITFPGGSVVLREATEEETKKLTFHVYDRSSDTSQIVLRQVSWVVEREAGIYRVVQSMKIHNPGLYAVVREEAEPPILRIGLAPGHSEVTTPFGTLPAGARIRDGILELRGPLFPGQREVQLSYDLPDSGTDLASEISFPDPAEVLELHVRDFGIVVDAGPLYPAPPTRDGDTFYQRYLGFDLSANTRIPFRIEALPPRAALPSSLQAFLAALVTAGMLLFVGSPLTRASEAPAPAALEVQGEREKEALIAALQDLEHDFETGKLSSEDRDQLRGDLRREALHSLGRARAKPAAPDPQRCACGHLPRAGDRFCPACGSPL